MRTRAFRWIVGAFAIVPAAAIAVACGLDEGETGTTLDGGPGLDAAGNDVTSSDGGTIPDVAIDVPDVFVPPTCATIDASCLGAPVPSGWALLGVAAGTQACPSADFDPVPLVEKPRLGAGSCSCAACVAQGTFTCNAFTMKSGSTCGTTSITQQNASSCVTHSESGGNAHVAVVPSNPVANNVNCTIAATGTGLATTDPVSGCRPNKCTADFCGLAGQGFKTCIVQDGVQACPNGFTLRGQAGGSAAANCAGCACLTQDGKCTGTFRVFDNVGNCDGTGATSGPNYKGTFGADGGCANPNSNFDSIFYIPDSPPTPTCAPAVASAGTGDAGLLAVKTICCSP